MKYYCITHQGCQDGTTASWVFTKWAKHRNLDHKIIFATYQDADKIDFEELKGNHVYLIDFCFKPDKVIELSQKCHLTILDHHKTAAESLELHKDALMGAKYIRFDMNKCGSMIAWEYFFADKHPNFLNYINAYDLGHFDYPDIYLFMAWFEAQNCLDNVDKIDEAITIFEGGIDWKNQAQIIQQYKNVLIDSLEKDAYETTLLGHKVMKVNCPLMQLTSFLGKKLVDKYNLPVWIWSEAKDGIRNSLRSKEGLIDVSEVAKQLNGGGHKFAAGFIGKP